jgi:hypothetical protein
MSRGHVRSCVLPLLACWLVLLASADDFNLGRFVLSPAESSSERFLPLDDPDCDFTESSQTRTPVSSDRRKYSCPPSIPLRSAGDNRTAPTASPVPRPFSLTFFNAPLRC